jgi:hypothetical protein
MFANFDPEDISDDRESDDTNPVSSSIEDKRQEKNISEDPNIF